MDIWKDAENTSLKKRKTVDPDDDGVDYWSDDESPKEGIKITGEDFETMIRMRTEKWIKKYNILSV